MANKRRISFSRSEIRQNSAMQRWFPLETHRLLLREIRASDEADIHAYAADPEVVRLTVWGPNTAEATHLSVENALKAQEEWPRADVGLAIELKSERRMVGSIALRLIDDGDRAAEIGYVLARSYWGRGYVPEAARAILAVAFERLNVHRVCATCNVLNRSSYRVMEKIGMRREGHFLKDVLEKGKWRDSYLYAILAEEWIGNSRR